MASAWIVKVAQDNSEAPVLLHITQEGEKDLHLDVVGTEGEAVYHGKVRRKKIASLKSDNADLTTDELESIIRYGLVSKYHSSLKQDQKNSLEVIATVSGKKSKILSIIFRNRIEGITQKIATIELPESDQEVSFLDWTTLAVDKANSLEQELVTLRTGQDEQTKTIQGLEKRLAEFVEAKQEQEEQLYAKFAMLLNEKKAKIRKQQRVLAGSKKDDSKVHHSTRATNGKPESAIASRTRKRERPSKDDSSSDGFEAMDVDRGRGGEPSPQSSDAGRNTPDRTESEDDVEPPNTASLTSPKQYSLADLPPKRDGLFANRAASPPQTRQAAAKAKEDEDDEETASEDDEL